MLGRAPFGDRAQLALQDPAPQHDAGVGAAEEFVLAVGDPALPGLHRDARFPEPAEIVRTLRSMK